MACAERSQLWAHASGEQAPDARALVALHLEGCPECRAELEAIRATRDVLSLAAPVAPEVDWRRADEKVSSAAAGRLARVERRWSFSPAWAVAAGAVACAIAFVALHRPAPQPAGPVAVVATGAAESLIEAADGAQLGAGERPLRAGERVGAGAAVRTGSAGAATVKLPDDSRVRVAAASELRLERTSPTEIGLSLTSGRVVVRASHAPRTEFVLHAAEASVRVIGTAFSVAMTERDVDVTVAEGKVLFELGDGTERLLGAGQRLVADRATWQVRAATVTAAERGDFADLGVQLAAAAQPRPRPAIATAPPPAASAPSVDTGPEAAPPAPIPMAAPVEPAAPAPPAAPAAVVAEIPVEQFFLRRAEQALSRGECGRFQEGLAEYLEQAEDAAGREKARILRARCFDEMLMPVDADAEYRRYLRDFPQGRFAAEARRVVAH